MLMWLFRFRVLAPFATFIPIFFFVMCFQHKPVPNESPTIPVVVQSANPVASDADAGADLSADAGPEKVRPTAEQLAKEYLTWELRDIEAQASTPEDKQLIRRALEIRLKRAEDLAPSNDFEKNMQKAIK